MNWVQLPKFYRDLDLSNDRARALAFTILTAGRIGDVVGTANGDKLPAPWSEIEGDVWTIPGRHCADLRHTEDKCSLRCVLQDTQFCRESDLAIRSTATSNAGHALRSPKRRASALDWSWGALVQMANTSKQSLRRCAEFRFKAPCSRL